MHEAVRRQTPQAADLIEAAEPEEMSLDRIIDAALDAADNLDLAGRLHSDLTSALPPQFG